MLVPAVAFGVRATRCSLEGFPSTGFGVGVGATRSEEFDFELLTVLAPTASRVTVGVETMRAEEFDLELLTVVAPAGPGVGSPARPNPETKSPGMRNASARGCLFFMQTGYVVDPN